ncbi:MAG: hypothetical protein M3460_04630 [Actinomycetota bacterium]|nr:hypothetical protein [Actinomycetota bacterium]
MILTVPTTAPTAHPANARQAPHPVVTTAPRWAGVVNPRDFLRARAWHQPTRTAGPTKDTNPNPEQPVFWSEYAFDLTLNTAYATDDAWVRYRNPLSAAYDETDDPWARPDYQGELRRVVCPDPTCGFELTANLDHDDYWQILIVLDSQHDHHAAWIAAYNRADFSGVRPPPPTSARDWGWVV